MTTIIKKTNISTPLSFSTTPTGFTVVGDGQKHIDIGAYSKNKDLVNVIIADTVIEIRDHAFIKCENMVSIRFPKGLLTIGKSAFKDCSMCVLSLSQWCAMKA